MVRLETRAKRGWLWRGQLTWNPRRSWTRLRDVGPEASQPWVLSLIRAHSVTQLFIALYIAGSSVCDEIKSKFLTDGFPGQT